MEMDKEREAVKNILAPYKEDRRYLIPILQEIQERLNYIPREAFVLIASHLHISPTNVYGVASFYNQFRFTPTGRHHIKVCLGTACHIKGGSNIMRVWEEKIKIKEGEVTTDREYSLDRVACVGCCHLAPVVVVGDEVRGEFAPTSVEGIMLAVEREREEAKGK